MNNKETYHLSSKKPLIRVLTFALILPFSIPVSEFCNILRKFSKQLSTIDNYAREYVLRFLSVLVLSILHLLSFYFLILNVISYFLRKEPAFNYYFAMFKIYDQ